MIGKSSMPFDVPLFAFAYHLMIDTIQETI
jgi:hypothetical protein